MRLPKGNDKYLVDNTWIPKRKKVEEDFSGTYEEPVAGNHDSILVNPDGYNGLDYYERGMLRSGATLPEIMFMRAMRRFKGVKNSLKK